MYVSNYINEESHHLSEILYSNFTMGISGLLGHVYFSIKFYEILLVINSLYLTHIFNISHSFFDLSLKNMHFFALANMSEI